MIYWRKPRGLQAPIQVLVSPLVNPSSIKDEHCDLAVRTYLLVFWWVASFAVFSGVHLFAWDYQFPSDPEKWLWRVASLLLFLFACVMAVVFHFQDDRRGRLRGLLAVTSYMLLRLCLIIQAFLVFRSSPVSVYRTVNWTSYIPAFG
jgi:hypothetical protein